jgi:hypothetical protein
MNTKLTAFLAAVLLCAAPVFAQPANNAASSAQTDAQARADAAVEKKAADWAASLALNDSAKEARVAALIATHLKAVRDWHNTHPYTTVPAGINPVTGQPLSKLDREIIADSAMPKSVNATLLDGLRAELSPEQVEAVLDKYTVGKVDFTLRGYKAIVPDLTAEEETVITGFLKQAREEAIGFKNMKQISAIFEIYKTKSEQYLNSNGRNWRQLYRAYTDKMKAEKAAAQSQKK